MGKIKIKKISPKAFAKALYKFTGAQQLVQSGKALSKCKPKDAKCIATNLGKMAMAAKGLSPAGLAGTVAKNVIKEQVKKKLAAEKAKKEAKKKLAAAESEEEKAKARAEIEKADSEIRAAKSSIEENEAVVQRADAEKMVALQQLEKAKLDPNTAKQADKVSREADPDAPRVPIAESKPETKIMGMSQQKFFMIAAALIVLILILK